MTSLWYDIIIIVVVVAIAFILMKWPAGKYFFGSALFLLMLGGAVYCGIQLNFYYTARGGIMGFITGETENNVVDVEDFRFDFGNVELLQEDGDLYSANILSKAILTFDADKNYTLSVNDTPINSQYSKNTLTGSYEYAFRGYDQEVVCQDALELYFAFGSKSTQIKVQTHGGNNAVKYWNNYFNRNKFVVSINEANYDSGDIEYGEGEIGERFIVKFYTGVGQSNTQQVFATQAYRPNMTLTDPGIPEDIGLYTFNGWQDKNGNPYKCGETPVSNDLELFVNWEQKLGFEIENDTITKSMQLKDQVVVPSTYSLALSGQAIAGSDFNITKIAPGAFRDDKKLTSIKFESEIELSDYSFYGCSNLKYIDLMQAKSLGQYCFAECTQLQEVKFEEKTEDLVPGSFPPVGNNYISVIPKNCFANCDLTSIYLTQKMVTIEENAFLNNSNLTTADLGYTQNIKANAFVGCNSLNAVYLYNQKGVCNIDVSNDPFPMWQRVNFYVYQELRDSYAAEKNKSEFETYWTTARFERILFALDDSRIF